MNGNTRGVPQILDVYENRGGGVGGDSVRSEWLSENRTRLLENLAGSKTAISSFGNVRYMPMQKVLHFSPGTLLHGSGISHGTEAPQHPSP
jgi:hypothetical protein